MPVSVHVEGADVGCSGDQVNFNVTWRPVFRMVGFDAVVAVGVLSLGLVDTDQADALLRRMEPALPTPLQVAQQLLASQSGMTGKLDRLERQELIERMPDPEDRRLIRLGITDSGRALIDEAFAASLSVYASMLSEFTATEVKSFEALLEKLLTRLDELSAMTRPWSSS